MHARVLVLEARIGDGPRRVERARQVAELGERVARRVGERVRLGYRDPRELTADYDLGTGASVLKRMATLLSAISAEAARK